MHYTHAQTKLWDRETLDKYPLLGKTFETPDRTRRVTVSSFAPASGCYRTIWADTHGWTLISAPNLLDPTRWIEVGL